MDAKFIKSAEEFNSLPDEIKQGILGSIGLGGKIDHQAALAAFCDLMLQAFVDDGRVKVGDDKETEKAIKIIPQLVANFYHEDPRHCARKGYLTQSNNTFLCIMYFLELAMEVVFKKNPDFLKEVSICEELSYCSSVVSDQQNMFFEGEAEINALSSALEPIMRVIIHEGLNSNPASYLMRRSRLIKPVIKQLHDFAHEMTEKYLSDPKKFEYIGYLEVSLDEDVRQEVFDKTMDFVSETIHSLVNTTGRSKYLRDNFGKHITSAIFAVYEVVRFTVIDKARHRVLIEMTQRNGLMQLDLYKDMRESFGEDKDWIIGLIAGALSSIPDLDMGWKMGRKMLTEAAGEAIKRIYNTHCLNELEDEIERFGECLLEPISASDICHDMSQIKEDRLKLLKVISEEVAQAEAKFKLDEINNKNGDKE